MAYATSNPPHVLISNQDFRIWIYKSVDAMTAVRASGYFTDGYDRGMRDDDVIIVIDTDAPTVSIAHVAVSGTTVDVSDGTAVVVTQT